MSHMPSVQSQSTLTFSVTYSQRVVWWVIAHISSDDVLNVKSCLLLFWFVSLIFICRSLLARWFKNRLEIIILIRKFSLHVCFLWLFSKRSLVKLLTTQRRDLWQVSTAGLSWLPFFNCISGFQFSVTHRVKVHTHASCTHLTPMITCSSSPQIHSTHRCTNPRLSRFNAWMLRYVMHSNMNLQNMS